MARTKLYLHWSCRWSRPVLRALESRRPCWMALFLLLLFRSASRVESLSYEGMHILISGPHCLFLQESPEDTQAEPVCATDHVPDEDLVAFATSTASKSGAYVSLFLCVLRPIPTGMLSISASLRYSEDATGALSVDFFIVCPNFCAVDCVCHHQRCYDSFHWIIATQAKPLGTVRQVCHLLGIWFGPR